MSKYLLVHASFVMTANELLDFGLLVELNAEHFSRFIE